MPSSIVRERRGVGADRHPRDRGIGRAQRLAPAGDVPFQNGDEPAAQENDEEEEERAESNLLRSLELAQRLEQQDEKPGAEQRTGDRAEPAHDDHRLLQYHLKEIEPFGRDEIE